MDLRAQLTITCTNIKTDTASSSVGEIMSTVTSQWKCFHWTHSIAGAVCWLLYEGAVDTALAWVCVELHLSSEK